MLMNKYFELSIRILNGQHSQISCGALLVAVEQFHLEIVTDVQVFLVLALSTTIALPKDLRLFDTARSRLLRDGAC